MLYNFSKNRIEEFSGEIKYCRRLICIEMEIEEKQLKELLNDISMR